MHRIDGVRRRAEGVVAVVADAFSVGGDLDDGALEPVNIAVGVGGVPAAYGFDDPAVGVREGRVGEVLAASGDGVAEVAGAVSAGPQAGFGGVAGELVGEIAVASAELVEVSVDVGDLFGPGDVGPFSGEVSALLVDGVDVLL